MALVKCNRKLQNDTEDNQQVASAVQYEQPQAQPTDAQLWLLDRSRVPHLPPRKVYLGSIHAVLTLQKKYCYAGWFRIKGYLEQDYGIYFWSV